MESAYDGRQVAGHRARRPRYSHQRRLDGRHPDADVPAGKLRRPGDWLPPLWRTVHVSGVMDAISFLGSLPYITGEIVHIDGQITGH